MSTALLTSPPVRIRVAQSAPRLLTAADLIAMPTSLPSGDVRYELDDGALVIMAPAAFIHAEHQSKVHATLLIHAQMTGLGNAYVEVPIVLRRNPDRVVAADGAFLTVDQLPVKRSKEGYLETIPKLVVEVKSKNDTWPEIESKAAEYLAAGVELVWVLDDTKNAITAYPLGQSPEIFAATDLLTAPFLLGFSVPVADFFA